LFVRIHLALGAADKMRRLVVGVTLLNKKRQHKHT
jgi:hypothetical protein